MFLITLYLRYFHPQLSYGYNNMQILGPLTLSGLLVEHFCREDVCNVKDVFLLPIEDYEAFTIIFLIVSL